METPTDVAELQALVSEYLDDAFRWDPVAATQMGEHRWDDELGVFTPDAVAAEGERLAQFERRLESIDASTLPAEAALDHTVALASVRVRRRQHGDQQVTARAPYWYLQRLGGGVSTLMQGAFAPVEHRAESLLQRLSGASGYLQQAAASLTDAVPPEYVTMGRTSAAGLVTFLHEAIPAFAEDLPPSLGEELVRVGAEATAAVSAFAEELDGIGAHARGEFAAGHEHFDFMLTNLHRVPFDHAELFEWGKDRVVEDRQRLEAYATDLDPSTSWMDQISRIKDRHPEPHEFTTAYGREMELARQHCVEKDLITIPDGEVCHLRWLPAYRRAGIPIAVMSTTPPFEDGLESEWLITPLDPDAPADRQRQHMRDNCYAFCRSIAGHEIYPGHHLQKVHHKLATADAPIRRFFSSPLFVEGWGLYTEDLLTETGLLAEPDVQLFKLRNALWRSARVVVDTGLHTRGMGIEEAADVLEREVCLDRHMAEGEVMRYIRHDNPTYPSSYLLGRTAIHELRDRVIPGRSVGPELKAFHDRLLSYGSIPVSLIAEQFALEGMTNSG